MPDSQKLFLGLKIRRLRREMGLTQAAFAERLSLSPSYLNQIENDQRPVTVNVLVRLAQQFAVDVAAFTEDRGERLLSDLREALADPLFGGQAPDEAQLRQAAAATPDIAQALLTAHQAVQKLQERLQAVDDTIASGSALKDNAGAFPYEEVRDYFHYRDNYIDTLDRAAERQAQEYELSGPNVLHALEAYLRTRHGVNVVEVEPSGVGDPIRRYDPKRQLVQVNATLSRWSQAFHLAHQVALLEQVDAIDDLVDDPGLRSESARQIGRIGLANYYAGALLMPYASFAGHAREVRHDVERLQRLFGAGFEQVCHRLSTLQRPGALGVPFFFVRVDHAGNITKRHSATKLQFARFGGACPLWNVHDAFGAPGRILTQIAETPDGVRYLSVARAIVKRAGSYGGFDRRYAVGLGCEITHAQNVVYGDGLDLTSEVNIAPIGVSCRICDRSDCSQRAFPPVDRRLHVSLNQRNIVPYAIDPAR